MKKLFNSKLAVCLICSTSVVLPVITSTSCGNNAITKIEAKVTKTFFIGESIDRDNFLVTATLKNGTTKTITDWTCEQTLPYTFVDTNVKEFVIKYSSFSYTASIKAGSPAIMIDINFVAGENGSFVEESVETKTVQGPITWSFTLTYRPTPKPNSGYVFDKWVDYNGNELTPDTVISSNLTAKCLFKQVTSGEEGMTFVKTTLLEETFWEVKWDGSDNILKDLSIPSTHVDPESSETYTVKKVSAFNGCTKIETVTIPETVVVINSQTFANCSNLNSVIFSGTSQLTEIRDKAFQGCGALASIAIPKTVKKIFSNAFDMSAIANPIFASLTFESDSVLAEISEDAFKGCSKLENVTLPNTIQKLGGFNGTGLKSVTLPSNLTQLYDNCFYTNGTLETVNMSTCGSLTTIGAYAFKASKISSITIPDSVCTICGHAFEDCTKLSTVTLNETSQLSNLGSSGGGLVFNNCPIKSFMIPANIEAIGTSIFGSTKYTVSVLESLEFKDLSHSWQVGYSSPEVLFTPTNDKATNASAFITYNDQVVLNKRTT